MDERRRIARNIQVVVVAHQSLGLIATVVSAGGGVLVGSAEDTPDLVPRC